MDNDIIEGEVLEVTPEEDKPDRMSRLVRNLYLNMTLHEAAIQAGYSETYAKGSIYDTIKRETFQTKVKEYAITNDLLHLPSVYKLEDIALSNAVAKAQEDPETAIANISKLRHTITQKKQIAGILRPDAPEIAHQTINIGQIQAVLRADLTRKLGDIEPETA